MEKEKSNRISYIIYAVTIFNCVFMLVSIATLCWNVNIHREVSQLKHGFDTGIRTEEHERDVRSAIEPGSQEDLEFRKREDQRTSMLSLIQARSRIVPPAAPRTPRIKRHVLSVREFAR